MTLTDKQRNQLNRAPGRAKAGGGQGRSSCALEAWQAIDAANRIFGPDGWDRETVEMRCAATKTVGQILTAAYVAKVRITVRADDTAVVREGQGCGEGRGETPFEAHEMGLKAAETDATRRALATLGRALGLGRYLGERPKAKAAAKDAAGANPPSDDDSDPDGPGGNGAPAPAPGAASNQDGSGRATEGGDRAGGHYSEACSRGAPPSALLAARTARPRPPEPPPVMLIPKDRRVRDAEHLRHVRSQPCLICERTPVDAHHLRFAQPRAMASKVSDEFTVPLCRLHHQQLHRDPDEQEWWEAQGIEPLALAEQLWWESSKEAVS